MKVARLYREVRLHILVSTEEKGMLDALAEADGLTASDIVRQAIRRMFLERWPAKGKR
jgi:predicted transcriptional regulator